MTHDSTWLRGIHTMRRKRSTKTSGLLLVCALLACALLAGAPTAALASPVEMRGEWALDLNNGTKDLKGIAFVTQEANAKEEFASSSLLIEGILPATFSGTLEGSEATVAVIIPAAGPFPEGKFHASGVTVQSGPGTLSMSGSGNYDVGGVMSTGPFSAVRLKSGKQIEEQEALEKKEQEEREARSKVRGEWSITIEAGPESVKGTALISSEANAKNEFSSSSSVFESVIPGTFSGTLEGSEASTTITTLATGPYPEGKFTATKLAVASTASSMSITGLGTLSLGGSSAPATLTATRTKTYQEVVTREKKEREAKEAQEKAEREAKEKTEQEAKEKIEREAKEKTAREAKEKVERETKERQEREAAEKVAVAKIAPPPTTAALVSVELTGKSFTASASGQVSLQIENPNDYAISARVTLVAGTGGAAKSPSKKSAPLGSASFGVSTNGKQLVKLKLSQKGRSELAHHKTLRVLATITTSASGQTAVTKTFSFTLHVGSAHRKA